MAFEERFEDLKEKGLNVEEGFDYTGEAEKYLAALQRFYRRSGNNLEAIEEAEAKKDYGELTLLVHALKSNAKTIGADRLSVISEEMENAGRMNDNDGMSKRLADLVAEYKKIIDIIRPYGEMEEVHPASEISAAEAEEAGKALIDALNDFEDEEALKQIRKLMRYPFRFTLINVLKNAERDIMDFEYTEALLKARRVISQIED